MKKQLLTVALVSGAYMLNAQQVSQTYKFDKGPKHPNKEITTVPGTGINNSGLRNTYFTESFDNGLAGDAGNGAWTTQIETGGNSNVNWEVTSVGPANDAGSTFIIPSLNTSTPTSWMMVDSDSDGSSGVDENCSLISPVIDLSSAVPNLKLEWEQFFAEWQGDTLYVGISTDGGNTWTEWDINQGVGREGRPNPEVSFVNISNEVSANPSNVQIRFRWKAQWDYGWQLDNVTIAELPANDLRVNRVFHSNVSNDEQMYSKIPMNQITPLNIGAEIENIGFDDQTNVSIDWDVTDASGTSVASGSSTNNLASLTSGSKDSIWVSTGFTPTTMENFSIKCEVVYGNTDADPDDDTLSFTHYEITDFEYAVDYGDQESAFYNWANNNDGKASIGNIFGFNADATIGAIWVGLDDNQDIVGELMFVELYRFDQTAGDFVFMTQGSHLILSGEEGTVIQIVLDDATTAIAGDEFLAVAGHFGGDPGVGIQMAGKVIQGFVQGYDAQPQRASLLDPSAPVVRLDLRDFTSTQVAGTLGSVKVYPNPASSTVYIELENEENAQVRVRDLSGKVVIDETIESVQTSLDVSKLSSGTYLVEVNSASFNTVKRIVIK